MSEIEPKSPRLKTSMVAETKAQNPIGTGPRLMLTEPHVHPGSAISVCDETISVGISRRAPLWYAAGHEAFRDIFLLFPGSLRHLGGRFGAEFTIAAKRLSNHCRYTKK